MPFNDSFLIKKLKHRRVILFIRIIISFSGIQFAKNELIMFDKKMKHKIFNDLFVLNIAYYHWENLNRGIIIIRGFSLAAKINIIKAAIRFQFKDIDNFINSNHKENKEIMLGK